MNRDLALLKDANELLRNQDLTQFRKWRGSKDTGVMDANIKNMKRIGSFIKATPLGMPWKPERVTRYET